LGAGMGIVYLADTQIPSRATNGIQIMRMCAAFAKHGVDVTLVHPHRFGNLPEGFSGDAWAFYGVPESFRLVTLPTPLTLRLSNLKRFARVARGVPLATWMLRRSRPGAQPFSAYGRSMLGAWVAAQARRFWGARSACRSVYVEIHDVPTTSRGWQMLDRADGVVAISAALRDRLIATRPELSGRILVEHDGFDGELLHRPNTKTSIAHASLGIDRNSTVVGYTGRVNAGKGASTLIGAAKLLHSAPVRFVLVGKVYADVDIDAVQRIGNLDLIGFVPPAEVRSYVDSFDILVVPTSAALAYSGFTSPLKLFEYMASGRPVVCSDLPPLREVVQHEHNALLFEPDNPKGLADAVMRLRSDHELAMTLSKQALEDVMHHSWENRARRILDYIAG
jgi:glycosyltransferase involved in cell wall biosynthesis